MTVASGALAAVVASVGIWAVVEIRGTGDERIGQLLISWLALWLCSRSSSPGSRNAGGSGSEGRSCAISAPGTREASDSTFSGSGT